MTASYASPVDKLLTYGDCRNIKEMPNYVEELGFTAEHIPELVRLATDEAVMWADSDSLEVWAPIHAWRVLGQLQAEAAIEPLISLLPSVEDNDWVTEELPDVFGRIGVAAIPPLAAYLADRSHETFSRVAASAAIAKVGVVHPEARSASIAALTQELESFVKNHPELNGFIVSDLMDLQAVEAAPTIERAFAARRVLPFIAGDWGEVQVALGLKTREEVAPNPYTPEDFRRYYTSGDWKPSPQGFAPTASKTKKPHKKKRK